MSIETFKQDAMKPGPMGLMKVSQDSIIFTGNSSDEVMQSIKDHYHPNLQYPIGTQDMSKHWAWGYFRMSNGVRTVVKAMQEREDTCYFNAQEIGAPSKHHEGAFVQAKSTFKLHHKNPDMVLFVMYTEFTVSPL